MLRLPMRNRRVDELTLRAAMPEYYRWVASRDQSIAKLPASARAGDDRCARAFMCDAPTPRGS